MNETELINSIKNISRISFGKKLKFVMESQSDLLQTKIQPMDFNLYSLTLIFLFIY